VRIDKYLKAAHILKRRTISKELAENQRIAINGRTVKPSHEVKVGDQVTITFGSRQMTIEVLSVEEVKRKKDAQDMYRVVEEKRLEEEKQ
jgi:ribosomal 50S subunit-recycling heat shock protein